MKKKESRWIIKGSLPAVPPSSLQLVSVWNLVPGAAPEKWPMITTRFEVSETRNSRAIRKRARYAVKYGNSDLSRSWAVFSGSTSETENG